MNLAIAALVALEAVVSLWLIATGRMAAIWEWLRSAAGGLFARRPWSVEPSPTPQWSPPGWELKAPDPAPGQCPVCGLEDLDELAALDADGLSGEIDPALVRVVAYGPHRAHYGCAQVVPYRPSADEREALAHESHHINGVHVAQFGCSRCAGELAAASTKPATARAHHCFGFSAHGRWTSCGCEPMRQPCAKVPASGERGVFCLVHNEGDPQCTVYPRGTLASDVEALHEAVTGMAKRISDALTNASTATGAYHARCSHCSWRRVLKTDGAAETLLREHSRSCLARAGVTVGKKPPEGFKQVGSLLAVHIPRPVSEPMLQVAADILSREPDFNPGGFLLLTDDKGRVVEGGEIRHSLHPLNGPLAVNVRVAGPLEKAHPRGAGVWVRR
jgi:hypothetical protein